MKDSIILMIDEIISWLRDCGTPILLTCLLVGAIIFPRDQDRAEREAAVALYCDMVGAPH